MTKLDERIIMITDYLADIGLEIKNIMGGPDDDNTWFEVEIDASLNRHQLKYLLDTFEDVIVDPVMKSGRKYWPIIRLGLRVYTDNESKGLK